MSPRVVLDTNILVSGLLGGTATEPIHQWRAGVFDLIVSEEILAEYEVTGAPLLPASASLRPFRILSSSSSGTRITPGTRCAVPDGDGL
jgi:predicted nucleic acid-binding protein